MGMERLLKTVAVIGAVSAIAFSSAYAEKIFKTNDECKASIKKINTKVIGYDYGTDKNRNFLITKDNHNAYILGINKKQMPQTVLMNGFPLNTKIEFPLQRCSESRGAGFYSYDIFERVGKVMYSHNIFPSELKLFK